jgi:hypothetical protein
MVTYLDRLKKGVIITTYRILKYPRFIDDTYDRSNDKYYFCEMTLSFAGIESAIASFNVVVDGIDEI